MGKFKGMCFHFDSRKERRTCRLERSVLKQGWNAKAKIGNKTYIGEWKDGSTEGFGIMITKSGRHYEGLFRNDLRFDYGVNCRPKKGKKYIEIEYRGEWKSGHHHGQGEKHYPDESIYVGKYHYSKRHGFGNMWYADGSFYCGFWRKDKRHGTGLMIDTNGNRYEGTFFNDLKHGDGRYYMLNVGQYMDGIWKNGFCIFSTMEDIPYKQSSSKATEFNIPKLMQNMDEHVTQRRTKLRSRVTRAMRIPAHILHSNISSMSTLSAPGTSTATSGQRTSIPNEMLHIL